MLISREAFPRTLTPEPSLLVTVSNVQKATEERLNQQLDLFTSFDETVTGTLDIEDFIEESKESDATDTTYIRLRDFLNVKLPDEESRQIFSMQFSQTMSSLKDPQNAPVIICKLLHDNISAKKDFYKISVSRAEEIIQDPKLNDQEKKKLKSKLVKQLQKEYLFIAQKEMILLTTLLEKFPQLSQLIFADYELPLKAIYPSYVPYLTPKGVDLIVKHLQGKGSLSNVNVAVCDGLKEFAEQVETIRKNELFDRRCFIVRNEFESSNNSAGHFTPVYMEMTENKVQFLITDSLGMSPAAQRVKAKIANIAELNNPFTEVITCTIRRQSDASNCAIFALRDAVQISKNLDEIMSWVLKNRDQDKPGGGLLTSSIFNLPPQMMKTSQSASTIRTYIDETKVSAYLMKGKKKPPEGESLESNVNRHLVQVFGKKEVDMRMYSLNLKVIEKMHDYVRMICTQVVKDYFQTFPRK